MTYIKAMFTWSLALKLKVTRSCFGDCFTFLGLTGHFQKAGCNIIIEQLYKYT